jgi:hypothetical protein
MDKKRIEYIEDGNWIEFFQLAVAWNIRVKDLFFKKPLGLTVKLVLFALSL